MASSGNKLESKEFIGEVVPPDLLATIDSGMPGFEGLFMTILAMLKIVVPIRF